MKHILIFSGVEEAKVKVINEKCGESAADDKTLPKSAYLVTYVKEEKITYDIVMASVAVSAAARAGGAAVLGAGVPR